MKTVLIILATIAALLLLAAPCAADSPDGLMVELRLGPEKIEGTALAWNDRHVQLLGRDGRLWEFASSDVGQFRKTAPRFRSFSSSELRATVLSELDRGFEVTTAGHYVVAHPRGQRDLWAKRLDGLYRSFVHYFSAGGFDLDEPPCPLVCVVCKDRQQFQRYSADRGGPTGSGVLGFYDLQTNRIMLYDAGDADPGSAAWQQNAAIALHEATHQTAFNTGIHSRSAPPPVWVAEGLATMFEAPGVYDSRYHTRLADRVHPDFLRVFRQIVAKGHRPEMLAELIASDRVFRTHPTAAYAEAWALTFYLVERQRARYGEYLALTARRKPFKPYTPAERTAEFTSIFGDDWAMLEAQLLRFVKTLP